MIVSVSAKSPRHAVISFLSFASSSDNNDRDVLEILARTVRGVPRQLTASKSTSKIESVRTYHGFG